MSAARPGRLSSPSTVSVCRFVGGGRRLGGLAQNGENVRVASSWKFSRYFPRLCGLTGLEII